MKSIKKGLPIVAAAVAGCSATPEATSPTKSSECCTPAKPAAQTSKESCCTSSTPAPASTCCASPASGTTAALKPVAVQLLFLDLSTCKRCQGTDSILDEAVRDVGVAEARGFQVRVEKIHVETEDQARALGFQSYPTIRVNGRDIGGSPQESACKECGALCGTDVSCRVWIWEGKEYSAPPKALVVDAIVREVYGIATAPVAEAPHDLPENLKRFFTARTKR